MDRLHVAQGTTLLETGDLSAALGPFAFDRIYGHYFDRVIPSGGEEVMKKSVDRYIKAIGAA